MEDLTLYVHVREISGEDVVMPAPRPRPGSASRGNFDDVQYVEQAQKNSVEGDR